MNVVKVPNKDKKVKEMSDVSSEKTLSLIVPGAIRLKSHSVKAGSSTSLEGDEDAYLKWRTAARIWALYSIDSKAFPLKDTCKIEVHIYYGGKRPDLAECLESIGVFKEFSGSIRSRSPHGTGRK